MFTRLLLAVVFALSLLTPATIAPPTVSAADCQFTLGFKTLHDLIPDVVGDCKTNEYHNAQNGDALQETTAWHGKGGLLVWRKADNWTAFTDGTNTWISGPSGIQKRANSERFAWEKEPVPTPPPQPSPVRAAGYLTLRDIDGLASLVANDGTYLGKISSDKYDSDSICNTYGDHGSKYADRSINNKYGQYGGPYSNFSPFNKYTSTPPLIVYDGSVVGRLTKNQYLSGAVDPDILLAVYNCTLQ